MVQRPEDIYKNVSMDVDILFGTTSQVIENYMQIELRSLIKFLYLFGSTFLGILDHESI